MTVTLVLPSAIANDIREAACRYEETAGVLLASIVRTSVGHVRILARQVRWVPDAAYMRRERDALSITSDGYVGALAEAERLGAACIWMHTHPGEHGVPLPSEHDIAVDHQLADVFRLRSGSPYYGAIIFSARHEGVAFSGHIQEDGQDPLKIDRVWQAADRFHLVRAWDSHLAQLSPIFDRNVRAFGRAIQMTLGDLRVGIVGCGGTGSAVAEQLVRLGVRNLLLIDPDELSDSNVTRVYGSGPSDVGKPKVEVLRSHLTRIADDVHCETCQAMVTVQTVARRLVECDLVFGCTDDNAGRLVLSRIATYFLTPVVDCGVLLSSDAKQQLSGIDGRVTVLSPGQACLVCRGRIDLARATAELMTPEERVRRADEGYAPALGQREPAVVAYTTMVGAWAVSELLERLIGYGPDQRPSEILLRCHEREISTNMASPRVGHYCHPDSGKLGLGMTSPFLEQVWPA